MSKFVVVDTQSDEEPVELDDYSAQAAAERYVQQFSELASEDGVTVEVSVTDAFSEVSLFNVEVKCTWSYKAKRVKK